LSGEWSHGSKLPGQAALSDELGVAPLTLRQALNRLEVEGLVRRVSRRGTFVAEPLPPAQSAVQPAFRTLFRHAPTAAALVDMAGRYLECNPAFERLLGYTATELRGTTYRQYTYPDDIPQQAELVTRLLAGALGSYSMRKRYIRRDGEIITCRLTAFPVIDAEGVILAAGLVELDE
jgi:PAS domain S-box-containing protein